MSAIHKDCVFLPAAVLFLLCGFAGGCVNGFSPFDDYYGNSYHNTGDYERPYAVQRPAYVREQAVRQAPQREAVRHERERPAGDKAQHARSESRHERRSTHGQRHQQHNHERKHAERQSTK